MGMTGILSKFDMETGQGLVWVADGDGAINDSEILAIAEAKKFKADAVYFRRFENPSRSIPQVYIYEREFFDDDLVDVHTKLWSSGVVPFFYIVTDTQVKIFNCTESVKIEKGKKPATEPIKRFSFNGFAEVLEEFERKKFSAKLFDNGVFWEEHKELVKAQNSPYQRLLDGLIAAKKYLETKLKLNPNIINKLLIIGILVRYLEEKEDEKGVKLLEIGRDLYDKFPECHRFTDILRHNQLIPFLEELDHKFNGKVFDLKIEEKQALANANLSYVAEIFDASIDPHTHQLILRNYDKHRPYIIWEMYSFNHLPIELISGIYEAFLKKEKDVVYTPPVLANTLIDECMPLYRAEEYFSSEDFKVLDPACGSGIFLVSALKRMVQWKAIIHYKKTGKVEYPDIETIKRITKNNIFGVDIEDGATLITVFSLCIALCDKLSPMQIWDELRFDEEIGEKNIQRNDFFKIYKDLLQSQFDLVIGNPPFNPPVPHNNKSYLKFVKEKYGVEPSRSLNDDNLALFFWDRAVYLRKKGGKICFILPSGAWLYNNNSIEYRSHFLQQFHVTKIIDFTHLSDKLFQNKIGKTKEGEKGGKSKKTSVAVCASVATDLQADKMPHDILHVVIKRSRAAEERFYFEVDNYDFHIVKYRMAIENPFVWKTNLLGGGRLLRLVNYLSGLTNFEKFLHGKKKIGWFYAEGYMVAGGGKPADWITDKNMVEAESFNENGISKIEKEVEKSFYRNLEKNKKIFCPPHILIKESLGLEKIPIVFSNDYLCFQNEIFGIHAPIDQKEELRHVFDLFKRRTQIYRLYLLSTSARAGVNKSTFPIYAIDIKNLPYPENPEDLQLGYSENIIQNDVLDYYIKSNTSSDTSPLNQNITEDGLKEYGDVFCNIMNPIYEKQGQKWFSWGHHKEDSAIAYVFCYGAPKANVLPNLFADGLESLEKLIPNDNRRNVRINRVIRQYLHLDGYDVLVLVKPKAMRYWLKSIALRDADETFADLKRAGF